MLRIKRLFYRLTGKGEWHHEPCGVVWRRYNFSTDRWETREMTPAEAERSYAMWAAK